MGRAGLRTLLAACALLALGAAEVPLPRAGEEDLFWFPNQAGQAADFRVAVALAPARQAAGASTLVEIAFACRPGCYVWHDSIEVELAEAPAGIEVGRLVLPDPKRKDDPFAGGVVEYLDGEFTAKAELKLAPDAPPGEHELTFTVRYTGCGPDICRFGRDVRRATLTVLPAGQAVPVSGLRAEAEPAQPAVEGEFVPLSEAPEGGALAGRAPLAAVLLAFVAGLGLCLTPCVYPLIPVTVALVGATSGRGRLDGLVRSLVYVFGISVTYSVVGVVAAATGGMFGAWLQHPAVYLALAVLFVVLAGGMFDLYSIELTSQRLHRLQAAVRGRAGLIGIWAIGLLSGAAATACIAPVIIGAIGYVAQRGSLLLGWLVFFAMAWGMGTPLVVLGTFSGLLRSLPKSGAWMEGVRRFFGLALVAVALYFVHKSGVLPRFAFLVLVGASSLGAAVFTGAFEALTAESGWQGRLRKTAGLALFALALAAFMAGLADLVGQGPAPEQGIAWVTSEQEALVQADAGGRPVLLDFWADWCAPCHRMFSTTFRDARVIGEAGRFACAKVDLASLSDEQQERVASDYGVRGVPTVVLIGTDGRRRAHAGYIGPDRMLEIMRGVP